MTFHQQAISDLYIIEPTPFVDERGSFRRHYCQREFVERGLMSAVVQTNISYNRHRHTLRGMHFQWPPHAEAKMFSCLHGALFCQLLDLRPDSPTFLKTVAAEINDDNQRSLYVPPGCANAFLTLADDTLVYYCMSEFYIANGGSGIRYDDPFFDLDWPEAPAVISDKDCQFPDFCPTQHAQQWTEKHATGAGEQ